MYRQFFILLAVSALLSACAEQHNIIEPVEVISNPVQQDKFVLIPDPEGNVGEITISNDAGEVTLTQANESVQVSETHVPAKTEVLSQQNVQEEFRAALNVIPGTADQYILYFTSGTTNLTQNSQAQLPGILKKIKARLPSEIAIIGHADTRADSEYNLALSLKRAVAVRNELLAIGAPRDLLEVSSHGENDPLVPTGDNVSEPKNRRVEVFVR